MARVLFLTELLPYPLVSGAKIRAYYVLRYLAGRHHVTLVSFVRSDDHPEDLAHLGRYAERVYPVPIRRSWRRNVRAGLISLATGLPAIIAREESAAMVRTVRSLLASTPFDVVHADQITMTRYGLLDAIPAVARQARGTAPRRLLDQHNATFDLLARLADREPIWWRRAFLRREARAFAHYEANACRRFDHVTFVTERDRHRLLALTADDSLLSRTTTIPICVDTAAVGPVLPAAEPFRVTHVGTMYWPPNVEGILWFAERVWPHIQDQIPGARLTLIGKNPPPAVREIGERPDVDVLGYVENLVPYLAETAAFIVPLQAAGGMRVKIVDAWCWGLPVVATAIGAEGIDLRPGENILLADEADEFAAAVVRVMRDGDLRSQLRANGRLWVEAGYDWRRAYRAWDGVYAQLGQR